MEVQDPEDVEEQTLKEDEQDIGNKFQKESNDEANIGNAPAAMHDELPDFSWLLQVVLPLQKRGACEVLLGETRFSFGNTCVIVI